MAKKINKKEENGTKFHIELIKQLTALSTAGFGLVAALAWNSVIQELVNTYIKKYFKGSGLISLLIYALIVTLIAVIVTYQLSKLSKKAGVQKK